MAAPFKQAVISPAELELAGEALYGPLWQNNLARELGMNERSVRYMLSGKRGIHFGIVVDLLELIEARESELHEVAKVLRKAIKSAG